MHKRNGFKWDDEFSSLNVCPNTKKVMSHDDIHRNDGVCPKCGHKDFIISHYQTLSGKVLSYTHDGYTLYRAFIEMEDIPVTIGELQLNPRGVFEKQWPEESVPLALLTEEEAEERNAKIKLIKLDEADEALKEKMPINFNQPPLPWPFLCLLFFGLGIILGATMAL